MSQDKNCSQKCSEDCFLQGLELTLEVFCPRCTHLSGQNYLVVLGVLNDHIQQGKKS